MIAGVRIVGLVEIVLAPKLFVDVNRLVGGRDVQASGLAVAITVAVGFEAYESHRRDGFTFCTTRTVRKEQGWRFIQTLADWWSI